jgi:hypothetical protein
MAEPNPNNENSKMTTSTPLTFPSASGATASGIDIKERFYRYFQQEVTQLQEQIERLGEYSLIGGEKQDAIDHVLSGISRLANDVKDSSEEITAYDQRTYSQVSLPSFRGEKEFELMDSEGYQSTRGETGIYTSEIRAKVEVSV